MFFTKKHKQKLESEIQHLHGRIAELDQMIHAFANHQGFAIQRNFMAPKYNVVEKDKVSSSVGNGALSAQFKL